jgi:hypothetical protein
MKKIAEFNKEIISLNEIKIEEINNSGINIDNDAILEDKLQMYWINKNKDEIIGIKNGISITVNSLNKLKPNIWLNDEIINYYSLIIKEKINEISFINEENRVEIFSTFFTEKLIIDNEKKTNEIGKWFNKLNIDLNKLDKLLLPININNMHWVLIVVNFKIKSINYYDSKSGNSDNGIYYLDLIKNWLVSDNNNLFKENKNHWNLEIINKDLIPQQNNDNDCGIFLCFYMENLSKNKNLLHIEVNINKYRKEIALLIVKDKFINENKIGKLDKKIINNLSNVSSRKKPVKLDSLQNLKNIIDPVKTVTVQIEKKSKIIYNKIELNLLKKDILNGIMDFNSSNGIIMDPINYSNGNGFMESINSNGIGIMESINSNGNDIMESINSNGNGIMESINSNGNDIMESIKYSNGNNGFISADNMDVINSPIGNLECSILYNEDNLEIQENKDLKHNYTFFLENTNYNLKSKLINVQNDHLIGSIMNLNYESLDMINIHNIKLIRDLFIYYLRKVRENITDNNLSELYIKKLFLLPTVLFVYKQTSKNQKNKWFQIRVKELQNDNWNNFTFERIGFRKDKKYDITLELNDKIKNNNIIKSVGNGNISKAALILEQNFVDLSNLSNEQLETKITNQIKILKDKFPGNNNLNLNNVNKD